MKKVLTIILACLVLSLVLWNCGGKGDVAEIKELKTYQDDITKFSLKYPSNWVMQNVPGKRFLCFSSLEVKDRFFKYDFEGKAGAKIELLVMNLDTVVTFEKVVEKAKIFEAEYYSKPKNIKIDGVDAINQTYKFNLADGLFQGEVYYATKDNKLATIIYFEAFGKTFEEYKSSFDEILKSVKLAVAPEEEKPKVDTVLEQAPPPSTNLIPKDGEGYTISIPAENFGVKMGPTKGVIQSRNYIGPRRLDCNILVDVIEAAKSKDVKKIANENRASYNNAEPKETTLGGEKAYMMSYQMATKGGAVKSRVYFALKNGKLFRITMNWFSGEEKDYLPVFDKVVQSFKFK